MRVVRAASLALSATLLAHATVADPVETVVAKGFSLSGIWKIGEPDFVALNGPGSAEFGPLKDRYCRIEQTDKRLEIACLGPFLLKDGEGTLEETELHLRWGSMMLRLVIDAALQSQQRFEGTFTAKLSGVAYDDPERTVGTKLLLAGPHPDVEAKGYLLKTLLGEIKNTGAIVTPHDPAAIKTNAEEIPPLTANRLAKLGEIEAVIYLGRNARLDSKEMQDFLAVYDVEFQNGSLLCGVHQRADGVLDAFVCA